MKGKLFRLLAGCAFALVLLGSFVAAGELAYRVYKGRWYWQERAVASRGMIQPHPYFGACNTPGASEERHGVRISHNSFRGRGSEFERPKPPGRTRLVTLGGSSTYCVGVSDDQTWPFHLNGLLPPNHEVVNLGAPGGTSVEILIQSSLLFSDLQPDVALYYLGWNDARVQHVQNLWPDYSDFHGKWVMSHGLGGREMQSRTAAGYLIHRLAFHYFFPQMDSDVVLRSARGSAGALTDRVDERALGLYERNVGLIAALCRQQGVKPVFIPQVLNYDALTADTPYGWLPFVRDRDLKKVMAVYNERLEKVARREKAAFIHEVLDVPYTPADFVDNGHFSNAGNQRFASAVRKGLERALAEGVK